MRKACIKVFAGLLALFALPSFSQSINPATQIAWPQVTGSGAPTISCAASNYGQPYTDTTNNVAYFCTASGWKATNSGGGVTQIVAGTNVSISPPGGTGTVTINASGGGNPSNTLYIETGSSLMRDDTHDLGPAIAVTAATCNGTVCTFTNSGNNGLTTNDWVSMQFLSSWTEPQIGGIPVYGTNYSDFKVLSTGLSATQFEIAFTGSQTLSAGNVYVATYWPPYLMQTKPYFSGHGTVQQLMMFPGGGSLGLCTDMNTNYTTVFHPLSKAVTGNPTYLIVNDCHNDFVAGESAATVETAIASLAAKAHTDGDIFVVATPWSQAFGSVSGAGAQNNLFFQWIQGFVQSKANAASGQYADTVLPMDDALNNYRNTTVFDSVNSIGQLNPGGAQIVANQYNNMLGTQGTPVAGEKPYWNYWQNTSGGSFQNGGLTYTPYDDGVNALTVFNAAMNVQELNIDTINGIVTAYRLYTNGPNPDIFTQTSTTSQSPFQVYQPNLSNGNATEIDIGHDNGVSNNAAKFGFDYAGGFNSSSNYAYMGIVGAAKNSFQGWASGEIDLPTLAPGSGTQALQISSGTGQVTAVPFPSGLPTATQRGQMIASTAAGTTYAVQPQIFYSQTGDTIASIEAECSSACTYVVTQAQTITLAASHALSSNVFFRFEGGGIWTVNGTGFTLSNIQVDAGSTISQHFDLSGTATLALSASTSMIPVEWFGATPYATQAAATTGTDSTTAIQTALNALSYGQIKFQCAYYRTTAQVNITTSFHGIQGCIEGRGLPTTIVDTSTTANDAIIAVTGTSGVYVGFGRFDHFTVLRSVAPTGTTDSGIYLSFTGGVTMRNVASFDSHYDFRFHASPSYGSGGIYNTQASWVLGETSGNWDGIYLDSQDGFAEDSIYIQNAAVGSGAGFPAGFTSTAVNIAGTQMNDAVFSNLNVAGTTYGFVATAPGIGTDSEDIHCNQCILDNIQVSAYKFTNVSGPLTLNGGWVGPNSGATGPDLDIEGSYNINVTGGMQFMIAPVAGIMVNYNGQASKNINISDVSFNSNNGPVVEIQNSNSVVVHGIVANQSLGSTIKMIYLIGSTNNVISDNVLGGSAAYGIYLDSNSKNNTGLETNNINSSITTAIGNNATTFNVATFPDNVNANGSVNATMTATQGNLAINASSAATNNTAISLTNTSAGGKVWRWLTTGSANTPAGLPAPGWLGLYDVTDAVMAFGASNTLVASFLPLQTPSIVPGVLYSAAGTALPTCTVGIQGETAVVKDATSPTYMGAYTSGGGITAAVICSYNGTTYSWLTH